MSDNKTMTQIYTAGTTITTYPLSGTYTGPISATGPTGSICATGSSWANTISASSLSDNSLSVKGDIVMDGVSLKEFVKNINDRLMIITPELEKMDKFKALRQAYDNYKLIEQLCTENKNQESP